MAEYIEREALLNNRPEGRNPIQTGKQEYNLGWNDCRHAFVECILGEPAADVAPVRHGRWVAKPTTYRHPNARNYYCSECRYEPTETKEFCPLCGARMDGE